MAKEAIILGGPNGAGKSTFAEEYLSEHPRHFLNTDEIAKSIAPDDPASAQVQAGRIFLKTFDELVERGENVLIESTLSGRTFRRILDRLKKEEYRISIVYMFLGSVESSIDRVRERVRRGGHDVPLPDLLRRFTRSKGNFWSLYKDYADEWTLAYNGGEGFRAIATGEGSSFVVHEEALFDLFMRDVGR